MRYLVALATALGCHGAAHYEQPRTSSADYRDGKLWLCRPDLPSDACRIDLATTVLAPDGTRAVERHAPAHDAPVDCFYIYPTVDLTLVAGNHTDFSDLGPMKLAATAQIARWSEVCNVYAPLYRQVTIGTYINKPAHRRYFDVAYSDIAAAFHAYLLHFDRGKPIVIVGHSQGAAMAMHLLQDTFDRDPALRSRLLVAMPIGSLVEIPDGATTGGTFDHLAACTRPDELGCVVSFHSAAEGSEPTGMIRDLRAGYHAMCVDPAPGPTLGESVFPAFHHEHGVTTPFAAVRGMYRARCVSFRDGRAFLEVAEQRVADDKRPSPVSLHPPLSGAMGTHLYDFQFVQGDLIELVRTKLAAWQARSAPQPRLAVTAIEPAQGDADGGTYVKISGSGFVGDGGSGRAAKVYFGSRQGTVVRIASDTEMVVEAPGGTPGETVDVLVMFEPGGELKLPGSFTFVAKP